MRKMTDKSMAKAAKSPMAAMRMGVAPSVAKAHAKPHKPHSPKHKPKGR